MAMADNRGNWAIAMAEECVNDGVNDGDGRVNWVMAIDGDGYGRGNCDR
jgi:hypothetical protein